MHYLGCTRAHRHGAAGTKVRRNPYNLPKAKRAYANLQRAKLAMQKNLAALKNVGRADKPSATQTKRLERLVKENISIEARLRKYNNDYQNYAGPPSGDY